MTMDVDPDDVAFGLWRALDQRVKWDDLVEFLP
jgi:hypothetical protein